MKCATHQDVETNLACATCGQPICPKCMIETPVGMKCRACARLQRPPMFRVSSAQYIRAVGAGLGLAAIFSLVWSVVRVFVPFSGFLDFFIALGVGYGIGKAVHFASGRKRGRGLAVVGGICAGACYFAGLLVFPSLFTPYPYSVGLFDLLFAAAAVFMAVNALR